jgi:hypothetical protein
MAGRCAYEPAPPSDYSNTFSRIRDAVAALPFDSAVLDGEAIVLRLNNTVAPACAPRFAF